MLAFRLDANEATTVSRIGDMIVRSDFVRVLSMREEKERIFRFIEAFEQRYGRKPKLEDVEGGFKLQVARDMQMSVGECVIIFAWRLPFASVSSRIWHGKLKRLNDMALRARHLRELATASNHSETAHSRTVEKSDQR
jgi:hypothetical protein